MTRTDHRRQGDRGGSARARSRVEVQRLTRDHGVVPGLAVVLVGDNPASEVYVAQQGRTRPSRPACARSTIGCRQTTSEAELLALVARLNADPAVHGILVQLPLPQHIDAQQGASTPSIPARTSTASTRSTPGGSRPACRRWCPARRSAASCWPRPVHAVAGRARRGGGRAAPTSSASRWRSCCSRESATVTVAHSKTRDLPGVCRRADLLFAAVGRAEMVKGDWIKPGATVIDVGINRVPRRRPARRASSATSTSPKPRERRRRDHAGAGRRRADDHRLPAGEHGARRLRGARACRRRRCETLR